MNRTARIVVATAGALLALSGTNGTAEADGPTVAPLPPLTPKPASWALRTWPVHNGPWFVSADGRANVWFGVGRSISRVTPRGRVVPTTVNAGSLVVQSLSGGDDGAVWFTKRLDSRIYRRAPDGSVRAFPSGYHKGGNPRPVTSGRLHWFQGLNGGHLRYYTDAGRRHVVAIPRAFNSNASAVTNDPPLAAAGAGGAVWTASYEGTDPFAIRTVLLRVSPGGAVTSRTVPSFTTPFVPTAQVNVSLVGADPHGNVWVSFRAPLSDSPFDEGGTGVARVDTNGQFGVSPRMIASVTGWMTVAQDGSLWFAGSNDAGRALVSRVAPDGTVTRTSLPRTHCCHGYIAPGPHGTIWIAQYADRGRLIRITP